MNKSHKLSGRRSRPDSSATESGRGERPTKSKLSVRWLILNFSTIQKVVSPHTRALATALDRFVRAFMECNFL